MEYLSLIPATALGYLTFRVTTHPTARIRKKMPNIKAGRVQIFPVLRLKIFGRVIHLHHWVSFSVVLGLSFFISMGIVDYIVTKGILLGGIIHGLSVPKANRRIIYKNYSIEKMIALDKNTSRD